MPLCDRLRHVLQTTLPRLQAITESEAGRKAGDRWSIKEEIGHLIDSAANNHLRFVRAALERESQSPRYDQNGSVALHGYQQLSWSDLLEFWWRYNDLMVRVIARIPEDHFQNRCRIGDAPAVTLAWLIDDYVTHLQHHLDHILSSQSG